MHDLYNTKVTEVYINHGGEMLIKIEGFSGYISLGSIGNKTAETLYSAALAAKLSQQNVWIRYWDTHTGYPSIGIISLK
jgi:hypothetical protein